MEEVYEDAYTRNDHFSFGKNWINFLKSLDKRKIQEAEKSLTKFLGEDDISGKSFVDIGCGSGLFSLAAYDLGVERLVSVDIDDSSLKCAEYLRKKRNVPENWNIKKGSALDSAFIGSLGQFDVVYSWGVLHHTGDMWRAIENSIQTVRTGGLFYIALYNKNTKYRLEGTSDIWVKLKKIYNSYGTIVKRFMEAIYLAYFFIGLLLHGINPVSYVKRYDALRGMDFFTDIRDWLGGYPYEFASVDEVKEFFATRGFECRKVKDARSLGCNEFLFLRK